MRERYSLGKSNLFTAKTDNTHLLLHAKCISLQHKKQHITIMTYLVLRLYTIGNVAMMLPVIASVAADAPQDTFVILSRKNLAPLFATIPNIQFVQAEQHTDFKQTMQLYKQIKSQYKIDKVIDLQRIWQTKLIAALFRFKGVKTYAIELQRRQKRDLLAKRKNNGQLKTEAQRYAETFMKAGCKCTFKFQKLAINQQAQDTIEKIYGTKQGKWLGIAPFAKYKSNMLPYRTMKEVIAYFSQQADTKVFLFGAGTIESAMLKQWADVFPGVISVAGKLDIDQEIELMRKLDLMLCMDSANQHLAATIGLKTLIVWGGTHPDAGYMAWKSTQDDYLQLSTNCRPCTINGTNKCRKHKDFECLKQIAPQLVIQQVSKRLYE